MGCGHKCDDRRPDMMLNRVPEPPLCGEVRCCEDGCPVEEPCVCPVHLNGGCVHYNGCLLFRLGVRPGDTFDEVMKKVDIYAEGVEREYQSMKEEVLQLKQMVKDLQETVYGKDSCTGDTDSEEGDDDENWE